MYGLTTKINRADRPNSFIHFIHLFIHPIDQYIDIGTITSYKQSISSTTSTHLQSIFTKHQSRWSHNHYESTILYISQSVNPYQIKNPSDIQLVIIKNKYVHNTLIKHIHS
jgi:hypothetical protein